MKKRTALRFLELAMFIGLFAVFFNPAYLFHENIQGDDASYVAHSFTIALDGDLDYCNEVNYNKKGCAEGLHRTAPPHPIGTGIVHAPLVKLFSLIDVLQDHPVLRDRQKYVGSWSFFGMFVSTTCCFILGLILFISAIESLTLSVPRWLILLFVSGYGVPYYVFQRFTMSHGPEFLFLAVIFWSSIRLLKAEGKHKYLLLFILPAAIGMSYLIRPAAISVLFAPPLIFLLGSLIAGRKGELLHGRTDWICLISGMLVALLAIVFLNRTLYGVSFPDAEQMYGRAIGRIPGTSGQKMIEFLTSLKYLPTLLFTSEFGLIFSAPVLVLGAFAAVYSGTGMKKFPVALLYFTCILFSFGVPLAVVLFWKNTGDAYGYRYLFSVAPVCIMGLVLFYHRYPGREFQLLKRIFLVLIAFSMLGQIFFASSGTLTPSAGVNAFGRQEKFSANGYELQLVKSATGIGGWASVLARRYPGFLIVQMLSESRIRRIAKANNLPPGKFEEVFRNMNNSSRAYRFCIALYGLLAPLVLWYLLCYTRGVPGVRPKPV